jgi:hypothetical protein
MRTACSSILSEHMANDLEGRRFHDSNMISVRLIQDKVDLLNKVREILVVRSSNIYGPSVRVLAIFSILFIKTWEISNGKPKRLRSCFSANFTDAVPYTNGQQISTPIYMEDYFSCAPFCQKTSESFVH